MKPFLWIDGATLSIAVTGTSVDTPVARIPTGGCQIRFFNAGTVPVFVRQGVSGVAATATTADFPIAPGSVEVLTIANLDRAPLTSLGAVTGGSASTLFVSLGAGL